MGKGIKHGIGIAMYKKVCISMVGISGQYQN
jgi:hypothetical protein